MYRFEDLFPSHSSKNQKPKGVGSKKKAKSKTKNLSRRKNR